MCRVYVCVFREGGGGWEEERRRERERERALGTLEPPSSPHPLPLPLPSSPSPPHHPKPPTHHLDTLLNTLSLPLGPPDIQTHLDPHLTPPSQFPHTFLAVSLTVSSQPPHSSRTGTPTSQTPRTLRTLRTRQTLDMVRWRPSTEEEKVAPLQK